MKNILFFLFKNLGKHKKTSQYLDKNRIKVIVKEYLNGTIHLYEKTYSEDVVICEMVVVIKHVYSLRSSQIRFEFNKKDPKNIFNLNILDPEGIFVNEILKYVDIKSN